MPNYSKRWHKIKLRTNGISWIQSLKCCRQGLTVGRWRYWLKWFGWLDWRVFGEMGRKNGPWVGFSVAEGIWIDFKRSYSVLRAWIDITLRINSIEGKEFKRSIILTIGRIRSLIKTLAVTLDFNNNIRASKLFNSVKPFYEPLYNKINFQSTQNYQISQQVG